MMKQRERVSAMSGRSSGFVSVEEKALIHGKERVNF